MVTNPGRPATQRSTARAATPCRRAMLGIPLLALLCAAGPLSAAQPETSGTGAPDTSRSVDLDATVIAGPLEFPWALAVLPDGRILITERPGRLRIVSSGKLVAAPVTGTPGVLFDGHGGLLDVLPARDFAASRMVYLSYLHGTPKAAAMAVMRARLIGNALSGASVIFESKPAVGRTDQIGGRLAWAPDGNLLVTLGDRFEMQRAQDLQDHHGKILRLRPDGSVPADNPFVGRTDTLPEIYSYGHRNPQGVVVVEDRIWAVEHGPQGGDEVNLIASGHNYGWPITTYGKNYDGTPIGIGPTAPGITPPLHYWVPSVAPSSMTLDRSHRAGARDPKRFIIGTLAGQMLIRLTLGDRQGPAREERMLIGKLGRIRNVASAPDGTVYLITDAPDASLYRLTMPPPAAPEQGAKSP